MRRFWNFKTHPSWCFYAFVWGVILGIIFSIALELNLSFQIATIIALITIMIITWRKSCRAVVILSFIIGLTVGNFRISPQLESKNIIAQYFGKTVTITGDLSEDPDTSNGNTVVKLHNLQVNDTAIAGTLYASISGANYELERSDCVILSGKLNDGFGTFIASMYRAEIIALERTETGDIFAKFKHWYAEVVREYIASPEVDLGLGYLMGMKSGLPEDFATALQMVGMTHVVVASGAHLAILTGAAKKLFGKISKFAGTMFSLLMILLFILIVGFTPSMTRAALVASLSLIVGYVGRKFTSIRLISFVAMITVLIDPTNFQNLGWQLSFASFFGILVVGPRLQTAFYGGKKVPWLASMLITSIATSLVCAPILIYSFGSISFLALVANLIILPTLPYIMLGMVLTGVTSIIPWLAQICATLTTWLLDLHIWLINFLSEQKAFILELPAGDARFFLLYLPVLLFLTYPLITKYLRKHKTPAKTLPAPIEVVE